MSIESILRSIGDDNATRLADAWHAHEREQQGKLDALGVEMAKATNLAKVSTLFAGFTVAALLASSLYVGLELGRLSESTRALQDGSKELETGMRRLEERFANTLNILKEIDQRTKRIEDKQQANAEPRILSDEEMDAAIT
jgi:hypothetical protein